MRILHIMSSIDRRRGGPIVVTGLAAAQVRAGLKVSVLAVYNPGDDLSAAQGLEAAGVKVELVGPVSTRRDEIRALNGPLAQSISSTDLIHVHALWEEIQYRTFKSAQAAGVPYVLTPHGMLDTWSLAQHRAKKKLYLTLRLARHLRRAVAFHATSHAESQQIQALNLGPKVIVEPLGLDMKEFDSLPQRGDFRNSHPDIGSRTLIAYLGRIHPGKGLEYLIPALAHPETRDVFLAAVGPDSEGFMDKMKTLASTHGVSDRVLFTGMMVGPARLAPLVDADVVALPSDHENFGMAAVEAIAAGTPVLLSDEVNIYREIIDAGVGWVVARDPAAIAQTIARCVKDPSVRQRAAALCGPFAREHYDWSAIGRRWVAHYTELAKRTEV
jgi:glycosyltransferase involved in cell wall biosynthesis